MAPALAASGAVHLVGVEQGADVVGRVVGGMPRPKTIMTAPTIMPQMREGLLGIDGLVRLLRRPR